jgi:hypothetical protein
MFENIRADLSAYGGCWMPQGFWAMVVYRFGGGRHVVQPAFFSLPQV